VLQGTMNSSVRVDYVDIADAADVSQATAGLDPASIIFDSLTGAPISGVDVELVDVTTGLPAVVYGNDGVSIFPSRITSWPMVITALS
jgi:hypothetical protein